jgi:hypothetical protein
VLSEASKGLIECQVENDGNASNPKSAIDLDHKCGKRGDFDKNELSLIALTN